MTRPILHSSLVLQLNVCWQPIGYQTVKTAFTRIFSEDPNKSIRPVNIELTPDGRISSKSTIHSWDEWSKLPIRPQDDWIGTPHQRRIRIPRVTIAANYTRLHSVQLQLNKQGFYTREKGLCGYCRCYVPRDEATIDHIVPLAQGGETSWLNCVLSCSPCNNKKGNRTPKQAGMILHPKVKEPVPTPPLPDLHQHNIPEHKAFCVHAA